MAVVAVRSGTTEDGNRANSIISRLLRQTVNYMILITPRDPILEADLTGGTTDFRIKMKGLQFGLREDQMVLAEVVSALLDVALDPRRS